MTSVRLPIFEDFIRDLRAIWSSEPDTEQRMRKAQDAFARVVCNPTLRRHSASWPSTDVPRSNLLLYEDPDYGFVINAVVRTAGRTGSVHDHAHAWVLYGVIDGTESLERYERLDDGTKPGYAEIKQLGVTSGGPGKVDLVAPYGIHAEQGGPTRSVALILRSERLVGRLLQNSYMPALNAVIQGSGPAQVPFELLATT